LALGLALLPRFGWRDLQEGLKDAARWQSANTASHRLRALPVMTQVALTIALLLGAVLLIKSFVKALEIDPASALSAPWRWRFH